MGVHIELHVYVGLALHVVQPKYASSQLGPLNHSSATEPIKFSRILQVWR